MTQIAIIGCGVIGAAIAYELSQVSGLEITVFDRQPPAQASTGAALGVLMGAISQKNKGRAWHMRQASLQRYETLVPELESLTGQVIPMNRQGIVLLLNQAADLDKWDDLIAMRRVQDWQLERWTIDHLLRCCPQLELSQPAPNQGDWVGAVYSPQDRQLDPTALTLALVAGAKKRGVSFRFDVEIAGLERSMADPHSCDRIHTATESWAVDQVVIAAGLGSAHLTQRAIDVRPVLGQALRVRCSESLGDRSFQPVITGNDIHIVPLGSGEYWIGATVEFPDESGEVVADAHRLETLWQGAIALCPALAKGDILHRWSGLRPRPFNRAAPIVEPLSGYGNVFLATGHYRNGVLLAPATAQWVHDAMLQAIA